MLKITGISLLTLFLVFGFNQTIKAQADRDTSETVFYITTNSGGEFVGKIISQDAKEVLIETKDRGQIAIPKYEIKEMKEVEVKDYSSSGEYIPEDVFATRYFVTTNGLPLEKGESYVLWNLFGPEIHFGAAKNFSVGLMTSWVGVPIIGSAKYSINLGKEVNLGVGALMGTASWAAPDVGLALPYGALTFGNRRVNLNLSAGYGMAFYDGENSASALYSVGFMSKVGKKVSFIFDSFFFTYDHTYTQSSYNGQNNTYSTQVEHRFAGAFVPGLRIQSKHDSAFQFGFLGVFDQNQWAQIPLPMLGWFKKL